MDFTFQEFRYNNVVLYTYFTPELRGQRLKMEVKKTPTSSMVVSKTWTLARYVLFLLILFLVLHYLTSLGSTLLTELLEFNRFAPAKRFGLTYLFDMVYSCNSFQRKCLVVSSENLADAAITLNVF